VCVSLGGQQFDVSASTDVREYVLQCDVAAPFDIIDIKPAHWFVPVQMGWSTDTRKLGVALHALELIPGMSRS
jgi:hypothetical protein